MSTIAFLYFSSLNEHIGNYTKFTWLFIFNCSLILSDEFWKLMFPLHSTVLLSVQNNSQFLISFWALVVISYVVNVFLSPFIFCLFHTSVTLCTSCFTLVISIMFTLNESITKYFQYNPSTAWENHISDLCRFLVYMIWLWHLYQPYYIL